MKISEQIKDVTKHNNMTITELALMLNTSQANFANKLVRDNFKLSDIKLILKALDYHDVEIVARNNNETVIIRSDNVVFKPHTKYMTFDENASLLDDIKQNGFRDRKFKDLVLDIIEPALAPKFGDLWDTYVPKQFEDGFKAVINKQMSFDDFTENLYTLKTSSNDG